LDDPIGPTSLLRRAGDDLVDHDGIERAGTIKAFAIARTAAQRFSIFRDWSPVI
jgi:hypothetical protein